jgi:hypothetical protein
MRDKRLRKNIMCSIEEIDEELKDNVSEVALDHHRLFQDRRKQVSIYMLFLIIIDKSDIIFRDIRVGF